MLCQYPISIPLKVDQETGECSGGRNVPCGKCINCLEARRAQWTFRLIQEERRCLSSCFLSLTQTDEFIKYKNGLPTLCKDDLQKYFKRVRKENKGLKYYAVGEYGEQGNRPHYHAIVFNASRDSLRNNWIDTKSIDKIPAGFVTTDNVELGSIHYVTGYILYKAQDYDQKTGITKKWSSPVLPPFAIMSKNLGANYLNASRYYKDNLTTMGKSEGNVPFALPRYYKNKFFTPEEIHIIGLQNLKRAQELQYNKEYERYRSECEAKRINKQNKKRKI